MTTSTLPNKARTLEELTLGYGSEIVLCDNTNRARSWTNHQTFEVWNEELVDFDLEDIVACGHLSDLSKDEVYEAIDNKAGFFKEAIRESSKMIKMGLVHQALNDVDTCDDRNLLDMEQILTIGLNLEADNKDPHFEEEGAKSYL